MKYLRAMLMFQTEIKEYNAFLVAVLSNIQIVFKLFINNQCTIIHNRCIIINRQPKHKKILFFQFMYKI